ncbi:MAG TPA: SIMPL domain-containing protein [Chitinophagaceae bacterium]|nr:SIMPL domain-containing protein [Chitinophagaceae bacterium]
MIVSDTAWVKPNQFVYTIMPNISSFDYSDSAALSKPGGYEESTRRKGMLAAKMLDSLKTVLSGKGFSVLPQDVGEAYATDDYTRGNDYSLRVLTSSLDSVRVLYQLVEADASFYGRLIWRKAMDEEAYQQRLLQKLMAKAKQKASGIAALGKLTLGGVLSVKEAPKETGG